MSWVWQETNTSSRREHRPAPADSSLKIGFPVEEVHSSFLSRNPNLEMRAQDFMHPCATSLIEGRRRARVTLTSVRRGFGSSAAARRKRDGYIADTQMALDELIDIIGRSATKTVLTLPARELTAPNYFSPLVSCVPVFYFALEYH